MIVSARRPVDVRQPRRARAVRHRADDLGRPFKELELAAARRTCAKPVAEALRERRRVARGRGRLHAGAREERRLDVSVDAADAATATSRSAPRITFEDVSRVETLRGELESNRRDLEVAYEELQSTIDELETTNEELQSANEELQTTNEELQSTNEELETMNEELQSTNEELETINDELRERTTELNQVNDFLETILTSLSIGVAVLDHQQRVRVWNNRAEDLWGRARTRPSISTSSVSTSGCRPSPWRLPCVPCLRAGEHQ